jgi:hypothetical protein
MDGRPARDRLAEQTDIYYRTDGRPLDHSQPLDHGRGAGSP